MDHRILSDSDIDLLKRALIHRCKYLGISPDGAAAHTAAGELLEMFQLGWSDERQLATGPIAIPIGNNSH
ncbi:hypothetical protein [Pararhizobium sp. DWP1-1-3]|uniref:hypothetical protein n=1 Tax=Pararhizobium sp. DWP1-1-3 TaxID=2804652 RepID=UPI003CE8C981